MSENDKLVGVLTSPLDGLICVERNFEKERKVPDKESQQDIWIQQLVADFASLNGELFGRGGSGGFVGEMRNGMTRMENKQDRLQEQLGCLQREMAENKVSTDDQLMALNGKTDNAHIRLDNLEPRVATLEKLPGVRTQTVLGWIAKAAVTAIAGGVVALWIF